MTRSDGLILRVGTEEMSPDDALTLAKKVVRRQLPGAWKVTPLGDESRDFSVRRPVTKKNPMATAAFDYSYQLQGLREVEDCEPALLQPLDAPPMMEAEHAREMARVAAAEPTAGPFTTASQGSSGGGSGHLGCTTQRHWSLDLCQVPQAWASVPPAGGKRRGAGIRVGHPDTGYTSHPQLDAARVLSSDGFDFEAGDGNPRDSLTGKSPGHGTSTGSVIMSGEDTEMSGVAPLANLVPLRVTTSVVLFSYSRLIESIHFAADRGLHVLSISLGGGLPSRSLRRAVRYATERGVIIVAAAGNHWPLVVYPARVDEVVAVAACNCQRGIWNGSATGADVDITAPGESVWRARTTASAFSVARSSGTSYATAMTAGSAALWLAYHGRDRLIGRYGKSQLASVFKELLLTRAFDRPAGWNTGRLGSGILNARKLLAAPLPGSAAAGGMSSLHASVATVQDSPLHDLAELFPASQPSQVGLGVMRMLNTGERQLPAALRNVGNELSYLALVDSNFRQQLVAFPAAGQRGLAASARAASTVPTPKRMSKHLKRMMTQAP